MSHFIEETQTADKTIRHFNNLSDKIRNASNIPGS